MNLESLEQWPTCRNLQTLSAQCAPKSPRMCQKCLWNQPTLALNSVMIYHETRHFVYPLVIKHGLLENPRTEWRFLARKITELNGPFSSTPCLITRGYTENHHVQCNKSHSTTIFVWFSYGSSNKMGVVQLLHQACTAEHSAAQLPRCFPTPEAIWWMMSLQ